MPLQKNHTVNVTSSPYKMPISLLGVMYYLYNIQVCGNFVTCIIHIVAYYVWHMAVCYAEQENQHATLHILTERIKHNSLPE